MFPRIRTLVLVSVLGTLTIGTGLIVTGYVIGRELVRDPKAPPGMFYVDPPSDHREAVSGRPLWLTSLVLTVLLVGVVVPLVNRGLDKWTISFGLCNPLTFALGAALFFFSPWYRYTPTPYQLPFSLWIPIGVWFGVFATVSVIEKCQTRVPH